MPGWWAASGRGMVIVAGRSTRSLAIMKQLWIAAILLGSAALATARDPVESCPVPPPKWTVTAQDGPDFDVCDYRDAKQSSFIGIYLGYHPRLPLSKDGKSVPGSIGALPVDWYTQAPDKQQRGVSQNAIIFDRSNAKHDGPIGHVWIHAATEAELAQLRQTVANLKWPARPRSDQ